MFGFSKVAKYDSLLNTTGKMYACGGFEGSAQSSVRTYNLASGAVANGTSMTRVEFTGAGFSNQVIGMQAGGFSGSPLNTAVRFSFADDTNNSWTWTSTTMPGTQRNNRGTSSANKGFSWAGFRDGTGDLTVNFQYIYASSTWSTGTALPLTGTPIAGGYPFIHSSEIQALWIGGGSDAGTNRKQQMIYTFANDSTSYTQTGAANFGLVGAAIGDDTRMIAVSGQQTSGSATLTTNINSYIVSNGTNVLVTNVPTAFQLNDGAGSIAVGIVCGTSTGGAGPTPAQTEGAYNYSANTYTLLNAYLANNNIYANKRENIACFSSSQTD